MYLNTKIYDKEANLASWYRSFITKVSLERLNLYFYILYL